MQDLLKEQKNRKTIRVSSKKMKMIEEKETSGASASNEENSLVVSGIKTENGPSDTGNTPESGNVSPGQKEEKRNKTDICDTFAQANVTLQNLFNDYSRILKNFKESRNMIEQQKSEIKSLKAEIKELNELLDIERERDQENRAHIFYLETKQTQLFDTIKDKDKTIEEKDNSIDSLNGELESRDQMIAILNQDGSKQSEALKNKLSSSLRLDYHDYLECKELEISTELGELFRTQLGNVFDLLKKEGIPLD